MTRYVGTARSENGSYRQVEVEDMSIGGAMKQFESYGGANNVFEYRGRLSDVYSGTASPSSGGSGLGILASLALAAENYNSRRKTNLAIEETKRQIQEVEAQLAGLTSSQPQPRKKPNLRIVENVPIENPIIQSEPRSKLQVLIQLIVLGIIVAMYLWAVH
jgi:hypothetical protein